MKDADRRSFLVALVPDHVINAPASGIGDGSRSIVDVLIELGYGLVQLPPAALSPAKAATAIDYALDQLEDYAANGYRTIWLASDATPADARLSAQIRTACEQREFAAIDILEVGAATTADAARLEPILRALARTGAPRARMSR